MAQKNPLRDWWSKQSVPTRAAVGGGIACLVLSYAIFGPGGLLSSLTSPSDIEATTTEDAAAPDAAAQDNNPEEAAMASELSAEKNQAFLDANAKKDGVKVTATGLQYRVLKEGSGKQPGPTSKVTVHYTGKLINGKTFDSSVGGDPISFPLTRVIPGWTEGLQLMKEGEKVELVIPSELGYGERGAPGAIPPSQALVFEVELIKVQ
jgi:FKBP-type peptidyl-prolyl cis-trans isomerase FkpA/FKBP-type peptidyl-prolyl cis-trans isomerase FklB